MRWAALWVILLAAVLVPFFLWEQPFNDFAARLSTGQSSPWLAATGVVVLLVLDVVLPIPSSIVSTAAGVLLGFAGGAAAIWTGMTAGGVAGYLVGARASRAAERLVGAESLARAARLLKERGDWTLVICRPVPVLAEASVIFAGIVHAPFGRFLVLTGLANLGVALGYAAIGAFSMRVDSFLLAFAGAMALPGLGLLISRLGRWGQR